MNEIKENPAKMTEETSSENPTVMTEETPSENPITMTENPPRKSNNNDSRNLTEKPSDNPRSSTRNLLATNQPSDTNKSTTATPSSFNPTDIAARSEDTKRKRASQSSSSIGEASSDDSDDAEEVQGSLLSVASLGSVLPVKTSLSKYYGGKSKSFVNLADAKSKSDLVKSEHPLNKKRKSGLAIGRRLDDIARASDDQGDNAITAQPLGVPEQQLDEVAESNPANATVEESGATDTTEEEMDRTS